MKNHNRTGTPTALTIAVMFILSLLALHAETSGSNPNDSTDFLEACTDDATRLVTGGSSSQGCCGGADGGRVTLGPATGLPVWSVSEPYVNLWLRDVPLGYRPAKGPAVAFELRYKQRESVAGLSTNVFGVGARWNCSWLSYVDSSTWKVLMPGGGLLQFPSAGQEYFTSGSLGWTPSSSGLQISFPNGTTNLYEMGPAGVNYYLTAIVDASGNKLTFEYENQGANPAPAVIRLLRVIDADGSINTVHYHTNHAWSTNLISHIADRFGQTNWLRYDATGQLTNITDVVGLSASLGYDTNGWITSLTTPYGTTSFQHAQDDVTAFRALTVTDPLQGKHLWVYRGLAINVSTNTPTFATSPYSVDWAGRDLSAQNSFHWGPRQYERLTHTNDLPNLTTDEYRLGRRQHWLGAGSETPALSMQQEVSPDGTTDGQQTWFDYALSGGTRTHRQPLMVLRDMPVGPTNATWFVRTERNDWGLPTAVVSTWTTNGGARGLRTNTFTYSADGRDLVAQYGPDGDLERGLAYSGRLVLRSTNALGEVTHYDYTAGGQLLSLLRPSGLATTNYYLASGTYTNWLDRTVDYQGATALRTNAYTYTNGLVRTHTDERGLRVTNTWDALGRLLRVDYPDNTSIQHTYSKLDRVRTVDRLGFTNGWAYDALRRVTHATNALGRVTTYDYCACGPLNSVTDPLNQTTLFYYDLAGRRTNTYGPDDFESKVFYNLAGQVVRVTDSAGLAVTNYYNHQGLLYAASNAFGRLSLVEYDAHDRATNTVDANGITITNSFDALGRIVVRGYPDGGIERFGYTTNVGSVTAYTNQLNQVTAYAYDAYGRKTAETNANNEVVQFAYSPAGDLIRLTDGKNQQTQWQHDSYGRVTNKLDNLGATAFRYAYDANHRLTNRWTPAKGDTGYAYDPVDNLTNINYATSPDIALRYDALNRLTNLLDAVGTSVFTYNAASQLLTEDGPWTDDTVAYAYTHRRRTALSLNAQPAPLNLSYGWDTMGRLTNVTSPAGTFAYDYKVGQSVSPASLVRSLSLPGGNLITNTHDSMARLLSTKLLNSQQSTLNQHLYGYNLASQRTAVTNTAGNYWQYGYDPIGQLTTAAGAESNAVARAQEQFGYAYDAAWNLQQRTNGSMVAAFAVDSLNQLTTVSRTPTGVVAGVTWAPATNVTLAANGASAVTATRYADWTWARTNVSYADGANTFVAVAQDNLGRVDTNSVTAYLPETTAFAYGANGNLRTNGLQVLEYDDENRLTTNWVAGAWKAEHVYDGLSRRRIERNYTWQSAIGNWQLTNEVHFLYDGKVVIQERIYAPQISTTIPQQTVCYTRGRDLSGSFQGAGGIGGLLARSEISNLQSPHALYHPDGNGNITCLVATNGLVQAAYQYDPYGNTLSERGPLASANRYRFSSKPIHEASGMYDYLYRWYVAATHRWLNRDPFGESGGVNLYSFALGNPTSNGDSFGLAVQWTGKPCPPYAEGLPCIGYGTWGSKVGVIRCVYSGFVPGGATPAEPGVTPLTPWTVYKLEWSLLDQKCYEYLFMEELEQPMQTWTQPHTRIIKINYKIIPSQEPPGWGVGEQVGPAEYDDGAVGPSVTVPVGAPEKKTHFKKRENDMTCLDCINHPLHQ